MKRNLIYNKIYPYVLHCQDTVAIKVLFLAVTETELPL